MKLPDNKKAIYLITGCYGFIGKKMVDFLLYHGYKVIGLDIRDDGSICNENFHFIYFSFPDCLEKLNGVNVSTIYHFAWYGVSTSDKNDLDKQITNVSITLNLLKLAKFVKAKRIVIPGSISEFSRCKKPVKGTEKESPSDMYSATKVAIKKIATEYCKKNGLCLNWVLITSVFGTDRSDNNLLTYAIKSLLNNQVVETTKLEQIWDYIYIDDLINALYIIGKNGKKNVTYPIGSGRCEKLSFYVNFIAKTLDKEKYLLIGKKEYKNTFIDNSIVDISKLRRLGFRCGQSFEKNIIHVIDCYKELQNKDK